jgi:hypothetical protein
MKAVLKYLAGLLVFGIAIAVYQTWFKANLPNFVSRAIEKQEHEAGRFTMTDYAAKLDKGMHSEEFITMGGQRIPCTLNMEGRKGTLIMHLADGTDRTVFVDALIEPNKVTYHYRLVLPGGGDKTWDKSFSIDELNKSAQALKK